MNIFADFDARIKKTFQDIDLKPKDGGELDLSRIGVEPPRDASHGDIATNAAMVLSKAVGQNPRELAARIAEALKADEDVESVDVAGPGFINLRLKASYWQRELLVMLNEGTDFGRSRLGAGKKVNVEYVSANPTGPMHVGHCRGAVVGDVLANLLKFAGYDVVKEYYINDAGAQIDVLARSVMLRYREALGESIGEIPAGLYPGDYLVRVGQELAGEFGTKLLEMPEAEALAIVKDRTIDAMMAMIRADLDALNVHHDVFYSERKLHVDHARAIRNAINDLTLKGHVYKGKLPPPKGRLPEDWEDREQTLFRSTEVGDDIDRPLMKSDGSFTYFAGDVTYFKDKYDRGFNEMIYVLGADHGGYVKRLEAVARAVSDGKAKLTVLLCQLVKLFRNGEPVRMSKRAGEFITLRDVVDEVGRDPVRFMMLYRKNDAPLDFDFAKVTEQSKDNPVFYVQYASARCHSVFRQAADQLGLVDLDRVAMGSHFEKLTDESEIALVRKLAEYPRLIESAAIHQEPHRLAFYLYDLASSFHSQWNRGAENPDLRFIKVNDPDLSLARLGLVQVVSDVLTSGLTIIGADAPTEMR
ncbi:arginyl-tRNA synthetase [Brucella abortus 01-4165]|uniref:Arginine--tRNA ligase n=4 Tax=Brucella abortus TaxID=235 RepID=SYR_BRUA2|nr:MULTISPECIES: arginine--tRNA ligase [Brucella]B2S5B0.1 RecName: Full=Arginine--tRNA ligase; AltName: Full=Arginyl-tRNA synthetase; Short=ArgRS [Brucella abortus S19]Q2YNJ9.1 RecName: Full=Arginine--tRNA ligase; AltName: Full=Arginyl-tRNA synthetase; Short=ArgRS [Brucella abortus 2308]Q57DN0.1 RecName: Full=Arginine--tRNA ligase; AltName: Full=Arginyl-tRNA synthetase; Short=ArgRS [Brucella abortus bv. 1 str. 9-941]KFH23324.1 arginyl-tRNA synthetase [Brucella abortus LMN1]AAX74254.1 ArgS, arg